MISLQLILTSILLLQHEILSITSAAFVLIQRKGTTHFTFEPSHVSFYIRNSAKQSVPNPECGDLKQDGNVITEDSHTPLCPSKFLIPPPSKQKKIDRRSFVHGVMLPAIAIPMIILSNPPPTSATVMSTQVSSVGTLSPISQRDAEERFRAGRESLQYLLEHYDEICEGGGDNVRRYLGTVGVSSGLFGIGKALKVLGENVDDIVEYTELAIEVEKSIQQADGSAYMAIFVVSSTSTTPPAKYFKDAKVEIERCAKAMDGLAVMIGLKL